MADTKISQLPAATTPLSGAEVVPLVQSGATVQTPVNDISLLTAATANTFTASNTFTAANTFTANQTINGGNPGLVLNGNTDYTPQVQATHAGATAGSAPYYILNRARGTYSSPTIVSSGDAIGTLLFQGYDGANYQVTGAINSAVDGTPGAGDMPGRLTFLTTPDGSTTSIERVRITSAGGVSFGSSGTAYGTSGQLLKSNGDAPPSWGGATTLLGTLTMTSGGSQSLTSQTLTNYKFLKFVFNAVSVNSTGGNISVGAGAVTVGNVGANSWYGFVDLDLGTGLQVATLAIGFGGAETSRITLSGYSTATTTITVSTPTGAFDAGSITVYGVS